MRTSLLILLHGSSHKPCLNGTEEEYLAVNLQKLNKYEKISFAYLSGAPDIYESLDNLSECSGGRIVLVPLLLSEGRHAREDISSLFGYAADRYPDIEIIAARVLGANAALVPYILNNIDSGLNKNNIGKDDAVVLLVGRGGGVVTDELSQIQNVYPHVLSCYLDINEPDLSEGLMEAEKLRERNGLSYIVIIPYLLSAGTLYDKIVESIKNIPKTLLIEPIRISELAEVIESKVSEAEKDNENKICYLSPYKRCDKTTGCPRCLRY